MRRVTSEFRTEFTVGGANAIPNATGAAAKAFDALGEAAKRQATGATSAAAASAAAADAARRMAADMMRAAAEASAAAGRSTSEGMAAQTKAAREYAATVAEATGKARKHYDDVAKAAKEAVRAAEAGSGRSSNRVSDDFRRDEDAQKDRIADAKRAVEEAAKARSAIKAPKIGASRAVQERFEESRAIADEQVRTARARVREEERELALLRREYQALLEDVRRQEADKLRAVKEAEAAKVAEARRTLDARRMSEAEAVKAAKRAAADQISEAKRVADAAERESRRAQTASDRAVRKAAADAAKAAEARTRAASGYIEGIRSAGAGAQDRRADAVSQRREIRDGMANPAMARTLARGAQAAYEAAVDNVVRVAEAAQARLAGLEGAALRISQIVEQARVKAAADAVVRMEALAQRKRKIAETVENAIRKAAIETARTEERAAREAARVRETAERRAADAAIRSQARIRAVQSALPTLLGTGPGLASRLNTQGSLSVIGGVAQRILGVAGAVFSVAGIAGRMAFGALSGVGGILAGIMGAAGRVTGGILSIGVSAVTAAGRLGVYLGTTAISTLGRVGSVAVDTAKKVASIARTVVIRAVVAGTGLAVAGYAGARKAVSDSADRAKESFDGSLKTNTSLASFQVLQGAAKRVGIDMGVFNDSLGVAQAKMADIASDPALLNYFQQLGVGTRTWDGRLRDTTAILRDLLPRVRQLNYGQSVDLLTRLFGSMENVEQIRPLLAGIADANNSILSAAQARQAALGNVVTYQDVFRQRAFVAATNDLKDAWSGLKLAVARAVGADVITGMFRFSDLIAKNRGYVADLAVKAFSVAQGMKEIIKDGTNVANLMRMDVGGARFVKVLFQATFEARRLAIAAWEARGEAMRLGRSVVSAMTTAVGVARSTMPFFREAWAAMTGQNAKVVRYAWLLDVQRVAKDVWHTIRGHDDQVSPGNGWMLSIRNDLFMLGRFARETWSAIRGDVGAVAEFPILLRIRSGVLATFDWVRTFAREAWNTVTGGDASVTDQFPWMQATRAAIVTFVADMKAQWADLATVWKGGDAETALGARLASIVQNVEWAQDRAGKAWSDLRKAFAGDIGPDASFNFPWFKDLAVGLDNIAERAGKAWEVFKSLFGFLDNTISRFTWGKLDLGTLALITGFATLFGVTRVVAGGIGLAAKAAAGLRAAFAGATAAAAGAGAAGAAGTAGGLVGAMGRAGSAAETAGRAATRSASAWGRFGDKLGGIARFIGGNPAIAALLGLGAFVGGGMMADGSTSLGGKMAGGALQGAGMGAMIGASVGPWGAAIGAGIGGAYGAYSGYREYDPEKALDAKLESMGRKDLVEARRKAREKEKYPSVAGDDEDDVPGAEMRPYDPYAQPGMEITSPPTADDAKVIEHARTATAAEFAKLGEEMRRVMPGGVEGLRRTMTTGTVAGDAIGSPLMSFAGSGSALKAAYDRLAVPIPGDVLRPKSVEALGRLQETLLPLRDKAMADPGVSAALERVAQANANIEGGRIPSPADFAKGLISGRVPPRDVYERSSEELYRNSPYARSPMALASMPPPIDPRPAAGGDTLVFDFGEIGKADIQGKFAPDAKARFQSQFQRLMALPTSAAGVN